MDLGIERVVIEGDTLSVIKKLVTPEPVSVSD
ncbi:hypothetical protein Gotur_004461 [Gossypium turneri]